MGRPSASSVIRDLAATRRGQEPCGTVTDATGHEFGRQWRTAFVRADGEGVDYAAIVDRFQSPLLRYVYPLLSSGSGAEQDAQDAVQDTFLRLHKQVEQHGETSIDHLANWLFRVAHNVARDVGRKRSARSRAFEKAGQLTPDRSAGVDEVDQLADLEEREARQRAMDELHRLPEQWRQVLLLKITQHMTLRQIAEVTGLTVGNVGYRITQGLQELSRRLKRDGVI